jgi:hypothetical protein
MYTCIYIYIYYLQLDDAVGGGGGARTFPEADSHVTVGEFRERLP